jgi:hypothetical protein
MEEKCGAAAWEMARYNLISQRVLFEHALADGWQPFAVWYMGHVEYVYVRRKRH